LRGYSFYKDFELTTLVLQFKSLKFLVSIATRPAWAGFKTAEEGRAKICKFVWQKLKNKSNIEKYLMNNFRTLLELF
jgi:hypothetical protein